MTIKINNGIVKFELVNSDENTPACTQDKTLDSSQDSNLAASVSETGRPVALHGKTYEIKNQQQQLLLTINDQTLADGSNRPYEILIHTNKAEDYSWTTAIARLSSALLKQGGDLANIADSLKVIFDPAGGFVDEANQQHISMLAAIGKRLEAHLETA
ncbi:hypothetical protein [Bacterioplanoides sp.]|uniref:TSCPD domain-containing protein n=1 Tax=Bacterioplanoides sp. TaxID=2066072 RepID=UPI003B59AF92